MPNTNPWVDRVWREFRARALTRGQRDALLCLRTFKGRHGDCWPAQATVAKRARCCARTVQRALDTGRQLGLVVWKERRKWSGWRWLRTSSEYRFLVPTGPVAPREIPKKPCVYTTGHFVRGGEAELVSKKETTPSMAQERRALDVVTANPWWFATAQAALAQRRAVITERMLRNKTPGPTSAASVNSM
jgi:hypothetical protein